MDQLPIKPTDGLQITDINRQIYEYFDEDNAWIHIGADYERQIVSMTNDGLVTPEIVSVLAELKQLQVQGLTTGPKILGSPEAYWYFLKSDHLIDVTPEGQSIRVEIDGSHVLRRIYSLISCQGTTGAAGEDGDQGPTGRPGPVEFYLSPVIEGTKFHVETGVQTPLETPISFRIYKDRRLMLEIRHSLDGSNQYIYSGSLKIDETKSTITYNDGTFIADLYKSDNVDWGTGWLFKVRQMGPQGDAGRDGYSFLHIIDNSVDDTAIRHTRPIRVIRKNSRDDILYIAATTGEDMPVAHVRISGDSSQSFVVIPSQIGDDEDVYWAAIEPTTSNAKNIFRWNFADSADVDLSLEFPDWTPLRICGYGGWTGFERATDIPCCQEDLFLCSEVNETVCD